MDSGRLRALLIACGCALVAGLAGGCGAGTLTITQTTTTTVTTTVTQTVTRSVTVHAPSATTAVSAAAVTPTISTPAPAASQPTNSLAVHDFSGSTLIVTVNGVMPATPSRAGFAPPAGSRLIALSLTLTDTGPGTISSNADTDVTLTGSDGQTYTSNLDAVSECTSFSDGNYTLRAGASASGCVVFQIPAGVSDRSVTFSLGNSTVKFDNAGG